MKHSDHITHIRNKEDEVYLRTKHFPVNMRLFNTSKQYREIILAQCEYIRSLCLTKMEGYKLPHGMSSANAGLAFNIIAFAVNRGRSSSYAEVMINPEIVGHTTDIITSQSNCGSLTLQEPIIVQRYEEIEVSWYDVDGNFQIGTFDRAAGSLTIQHEVDHNNGILITDREN
jgi:peptide deformylase